MPKSVQGKAKQLIHEMYLGVVLGRIRLYGRLTLTAGTGYQFAVSDAHPQYEKNWILSVRTNF
jgi:hypothetical protein